MSHKTLHSHTQQRSREPRLCPDAQPQCSMTHTHLTFHLTLNTHTCPTPPGGHLLPPPCIGSTHSHPQPAQPHPHCKCKAQCISLNPPSPPPLPKPPDTPRWPTGTGSLFSLLKSLGWASSLVAGESGSSLSCASFFYISVELTLEGYEHVQEVGAAIFRCGTWPRVSAHTHRTHSV